MASTPSRVTSALTSAVLPQPGASAAALSAAAAVYAKTSRVSVPTDDRRAIAQPWQIEAYRHVNICGEARYAAVLFSAIAGRAEIGVSEPNALNNKPKWVNVGEEVELFAELAPTVRERSRLIREYMTHRTIAGECYLVARERLRTDTGYQPPPIDERTGVEYIDWDAYLRAQASSTDLMEMSLDDLEVSGNPNIDNPIWEVVAVTEIRHGANGWEVRHDNENWIRLRTDDPVIRLWCADPANRREAWSPFRSALPVLREVEWLTAHIFAQVRSRLMSAGVWFLPNNLTFPAPPPDAVEGGAETIAALNEAERLMLSLAASATQNLDPDEVSFPTVMLADPEALAAIDQDKLIKFWSDIDDKAMTLRTDALDRFSAAMDMPDGKTRDKSTSNAGSSQSGGGQNHWGKWAEQEETISEHVEPALDDFVGTLTEAFLRMAMPNTKMVIAYDTASLRLRQDRSKQAMELNERGLLSNEVTLRENGFDPDLDKMPESERRMMLLMKVAGGSATPEQVNESLRLLGVILNVQFDSQQPQVSGNTPAPLQPGRNQAPSLEEHPYQGPPREQHDHSEAPFSAFVASCEGLVLRALEKSGNRVLNDGKRGRDRDRDTPPIEAHLTASVDVDQIGDFDFSIAPVVLSDLSPARRAYVVSHLNRFCARLYMAQRPYSRDRLDLTLRSL